MYYPNTTLEPVCYEAPHISLVLQAFDEHFDDYCLPFLEEVKYGVTGDTLAALAEKFPTVRSRERRKPKAGWGDYFDRAITDFETERRFYQEVLSPEVLEEYGEDIGPFKNSALAKEIPIIRRTLQNRQAKKLDKYRIAFQGASATDLYNVVRNISEFAHGWREDAYEEESFDRISSFEELGFGVLDDEKYTAYGVIGGGIKSHFLYRLFPEIFPYRSRDAIWALYYLSGRENFSCEQDSEFLMINRDEGTTHQNYYYPYGLFAFYAHDLYKRLKTKIADEGVALPSEYRFVILDAFMSHVADRHRPEIEILTRKSDSEYEY